MLVDVRICWLVYSYGLEAEGTMLRVSGDMGLPQRVNGKMRNKGDHLYRSVL